MSPANTTFTVPTSNLTAAWDVRYRSDVSVELPQEQKALEDAAAAARLHYQSLVQLPALVSKPDDLRQSRLKISHSCHQDLLSFS